MRQGGGEEEWLGLEEGLREEMEEGKRGVSE